MRLRLQEADRQRLGCPEFLPVSIRITNREAIRIKGLGFSTIGILLDALDQPGQYEAWTALVWLALKQANIDVDPDTLEFSIPVEVHGDEEPEPVVVEGKAEEVLGASTSSAVSS